MSHVGRADGSSAPYPEADPSRPRAPLRYSTARSAASPRSTAEVNSGPRRARPLMLFAGVFVDLSSAPVYHLPPLSNAQ